MSPIARVVDDDPKISGGDVDEATPDPIPNSEVKLLGADGTAREAVWESRTLPGNSIFLPLTKSQWKGRCESDAAKEPDYANA